MLDHRVESRRSMAGNSGQMHRSSRLCYRYRRVVYVAVFIVVSQLLAAWTFFFALENEKEGRGRRDEVVWSADRELGRGGLEEKLSFNNVNPKLSGVHDAIQVKASQVKISPDVGKHHVVRPPTLAIFKEVAEQFNNINDAPVVNRQTQTEATLEKALPLDRRRTGTVERDATNTVGNQELNRSKVLASDQENSNLLANSANSKWGIHVAASPVKDKQDGGGVIVEASPTGNVTVKLGYSARCSVKAKDVSSALGRATTQQCKQNIADTYCDMQDGLLYPSVIPRYCPLEGKPKNEIKDNPKFKIVEEDAVRILYVLVVHGRALRQVRRLIRLLYHTDHYFYIHVDSRSDYLHREVAKATKGFANVRLTPWRLATIWGGASLLQVYLRCMEDLLEMDDWNWDFFINLSESDMPIKTNDYLVSFLSRYRKNNFLKSHGSDDDRFIKKQGLDKTFYECDTHMWRLGDRQLPTGIVMDGGSDWIAINRQFVEYLMRSKNDMLTGLKQLYKYTLLPAESFFHSVLENSELCGTLVDNNLRVTNWKRKLGCQCQYKHIVDWCGCSPNDFKPDDFYKTKPSRPAFFARKFEPIINQAVINELDSWLYGSYSPGTPGDRSYWQNLYHQDDSITRTSDVSLTVYQSFVRLMAAHINVVSQGQSYDAHCAYSINASPQEVSLYMENDILRGVVVMVEGLTAEGATDLLEVWLSLSNEFKITNYVGPSVRLEKFQIATQFDLKERVLRNFVAIMGPTDNPIVFLKWKHGEQSLVTITWIDPTNHIAASFDTTVDGDKEETHHSPLFKKPLRPGKWYVKLLFQWMVVAEVEFLVVPLALKDGKAISPDDAAEVNCGVPGNSYVDKDFSSMKSIFQLSSSEPLVEAADKRAQSDGAKLNEWVDEVIGQHWSVMGFCVAPSNGTKLADCGQFKPCYGRPWSTKSPDPKSELLFIKSDGRIR